MCSAQGQAQHSSQGMVSHATALFESLLPVYAHQVVTYLHWNMKNFNIEFETQHTANTIDDDNPDLEAFVSNSRAIIQAR